MTQWAGSVRNDFYRCLALCVVTARTIYHCSIFVGCESVRLGKLS
jgi:hypothetical protein